MRLFTQFVFDFFKATTAPTIVRKALPKKRNAVAKRKGDAERPERSQSARQLRYDSVVDAMQARYGFRVRKWRTNLSGVAIRIERRDGTIEKLLEAPYPTSPLRCAIFLHEVGHHALGVGSISPRCLEEHAAWMWSLDAMREHGCVVDEKVERRVDRSLKYAVAKAMRRGMRRLPIALVPYLPEHAQIQTTSIASP
ncbi:MAG: hypothetical protein EXS10_09540 [Phycisphaerales bacterium]|nr:hypothetical protein [Phycisphaerales bacterium]